jgi:hypothetical protein
LLRETTVIAALALAGCGTGTAEPASEAAPEPRSGLAAEPAADVLGEECLLVDEGGRPLAGWMIEANVERPTRSGEVLTDRVLAVTNGSGRFPRLGRSAAVRLVAWAPGSDGVVSRRLDPERVDFSATGIRLRLARSREIKGRVQSEWAWAVGTGRVTAVRHRRGTTEPCPAGNDRWVSIRDLEPGDTVDVTAEAPGHDPMTLTGVVPGSVLDFRLVPRVRPVEGVVHDLDGRPIAFAWVRFRPRAGGLVEQTLCDVDGRFTETHTLDMDYDVTVLVPHPTKSSEPGVPAGRVTGGDRDVVLRVRR